MYQLVVVDTYKTQPICLSVQRIKFNSGVKVTNESRIKTQFFRMRKCWFSGRRHYQISIKLTISLLVVVFYITILYRESLQAIDQKNRERIRKKNSINSSILNSSGQYSRDKTSLSVSNQTIDVIQSYWNSPKPPLTVTTLNPVYEYSEEIHRAIEQNLQQRQKHLQETCKKYALEAIYPPRSQEFFISTGHNLVWCNVFKAASSTWMYYFNILGK